MIRSSPSRPAGRPPGAAAAVALAVVLLALPGRAQPPLAKDLLDAYVRSDFDRLARTGRRASASGLAPLLGGGDVAVVRAAIAAAPSAEDAWSLLGDLARLARSPDRQLAPPAARAAALITQSLDPIKVRAFEITSGQLHGAAVVWRKLAQRAGTWPDVRVHAIEINALLTALLAEPERPGAAIDLLAIAADPEPEVRRAALELLPEPLSAPAREQTATVVRSDADPVVAVVAAQVLCGGVALGDDAAPLIAALGTGGLERVRRLVDNPHLPLAARLDAAQCLAASASKEDRRALAELSRTVPRFARRLVRQLVRRGARR